MSLAEQTSNESPYSLRLLRVRGPHLFKYKLVEGESRRRRSLARARLEELERACVLVAEDDPAMRRLLVDALTDAGYRVVEVASGNQLSHCLEETHGTACPRPDLVVSDIKMPGHSGLDALAALRRSDWTMPVILITAFPDDETRNEAKRLGAARVLEKPFDVDDLVRAAQDLVPPKL